MSLSFKISDLSVATREKISNLRVDANADAVKKKFGHAFQTKPKKWIYPYRLDENTVTLPLAWSLKHVDGSVRRDRSEFSQVRFKCNVSLRPAQTKIRKEAFVHLNKRGTIVISAFPGFGKTITSISMAQKIGMRTLVLVNKVILISQWISAVKQFTDLDKNGVIKVAPMTKAQRTNPSKITKWKNKINKASILVMNALSVCKLPDDMLKNVGCVIVDECHQLMSPCLSSALLYVQPRYVIALSATPYRSDGLNKLLDFYFSKERLVRELKKAHTVFEIRTGFKPAAGQTEQGRLDWNGLLNSQSENDDRNKLIIDTATVLSKNRTILILTKRVDQAALIEKKLKENDVSATGLYGAAKTFDESASVLVGTASKIGVGFDHKKLDCLFLASDVEAYFIQFLGRVFRREDVEPIVLDFVDTHPVLRKHFRTRKSVYQKHGGTLFTIKNIQNGTALAEKIRRQTAASRAQEQILTTEEDVMPSMQQIRAAARSTVSESAWNNAISVSKAVLSGETWPSSVSSGKGGS